MQVPTISIVKIKLFGWSRTFSQQGDKPITHQAPIKQLTADALMIPTITKDQEAKKATKEILGAR